MKIRDIIETIGKRDLPLAGEHDSIEEIVKKMVHYPHTRLIYIVDEEGRCRGTISLGTLIRHLFSRGYEPAVHPRHLLPMITSGKSGDIMNKRVIHAEEDEEIEVVLKRMIKAGVKEIAVLDKQKRIMADITMLDLLAHYHITEEH